MNHLRRRNYRDFRYAGDLFGFQQHRHVGVAAGVAVTVATVAAAGLQIAKSAGAFDGGGAPGTPGYIPPSTSELSFNRGTRQILDAERSILDDALAQGKFVEPDMYRALGLEPIYDRPEDPELAGLSTELAGKQDRVSEIQRELAALRGKKGARYHQLRRERKQLNKEVSSLSGQLEQRGAVGRRVVGFRRLEGVADPTGSAGGEFGAALDDFNQGLARALKGEEPLDPTLKREFDEKEQVLRERLRRQMGPDYETSTAGRQALANFDRERSEAFAQFNRQSIAFYSELAEGRAGTLSELTSERLRNLAFPSSFRASLATQLEGAAEARRRFATGGAEERSEKAGAIARQREAAAAERAARVEGISNILAGVSGAGGSINRLGGQANTALLGESVAPGLEGPPTQGSLGVGGELGGGKLQNLLGQ